MGDAIPYETTLTMQSYVQMRDATDLDFLDVFTPSTRLERELGWDMQLRNLKGVVFQYKRPKLSESGTRRFPVRYSGQDPPRQLATVKNYAKKYGENTAYYAFPLVAEHNELDSTLKRTAFVKALEIPDFASVIHVPVGYCSNGRRQSSEPLEVHCSDPLDTSNSWTDSIDSAAVLGWAELYEQIKNCTLGFKIRYRGDTWVERYHDDHRYFPHDDEAHWDDYPTAELFGLTQESGPLVTRFGSDNDEVFG